MDLEIFKDLAINTAKSSGKILMSYFNTKYDIKKKSSVDLVTKADIESEQNIITAILNKFPDHSVIAEESHLIDNNSDYRWVIDPLDGTTNFVHSLPIFAVSIALQYKKETILGVVYNPAYKKCFWATKDGGAFQNNIKISISNTKKLIDSLLVTGFPYNHNESWDKSFELFHELYSKTQGIRRLGAASLDFCFVAMGRFEGFYEFNLKPWDVCAGDLICREAGGKTSDWKGYKMPFSGSNIIASNNIIHKKILDIITQDKYDLILN